MGENGFCYSQGLRLNSLQRTVGKAVIMIQAGLRKSKCGRLTTAGVQAPAFIAKWPGIYEMG